MLLSTNGYMFYAYMDIWPFVCVEIRNYVKVVPYTLVRRGMPVREDTYAEPSAYEVGWPVPFLAAFISPVLPPGIQCCWVNRERTPSQGIESGSNRRPSARESCVLTNMLPCP